MSIKPWHLKKEQFFSQFFHLSLFSQLNHCQKIQALQLSIFNFCMSTELFFSTTQNQSRQEAQFSNKLFHFNSKFNYLRRGGQQKLHRFSQESLHWYIYFLMLGLGCILIQFRAYLAFRFVWSTYPVGMPPQIGIAI